jgi:DNA-directed RNA polymerase subunit omega
LLKNFDNQFPKGEKNMLRPSYTDLLEIINKNGKNNDVTGSRYSIVVATSKRARQLIDHDEPLVETGKDSKPVSIAVDELYHEKIKIVEDGDICCGEKYEAIVAEKRAKEEKAIAEAAVRKEAELSEEPVEKTDGYESKTEE